MERGPSSPPTTHPPRSNRRPAPALVSTCAHTPPHLCAWCPCSVLTAALSAYPWLCHAHTCLFPSLAPWLGAQLGAPHPAGRGRRRLGLLLRPALSHRAWACPGRWEPSGQNSALQVQGPGTYTSRPAEAPSCHRHGPCLGSHRSRISFLRSLGGGPAVGTVALSGSWQASPSLLGEAQKTNQEIQSADSCSAHLGLAIHPPGT